MALAPEASEANKDPYNDANEVTDDENRMCEVYTYGWSHAIYTSQSTSFDLILEENGWHMLSTFLTSSLGIGKCVDSDRYASTIALRSK